MKQLLIISGKGGTGKTTVASALIKLSEAKAYADCDVDAPNLHLVGNWESEPKNSLYYGMSKAEVNMDLCIECGKCIEHCRFDAISSDPNYEVNQFACEGCGVCEHVCPVGAISLKPAVAGDLYLYKDVDSVFSTAKLKIGSGNSGKLVTEVKNQMKESATVGEIAIIDGSPGIGCPVIASLSGVDMVLIVAEPSISGLSDMVRIIDTAKGFGVKIATCINKYDINMEKTKEIEETCSTYGIPVVGRIPYDSCAVKAVNDGKTIVDMDCKSGEAVREVYEKVIKSLLE
ncbi:MAG: 4Fe-4S binding protein [Tissierellia bacterium]|nr:4Fe-4S binding protein [Tissierellia bacterium]